MAKNKMIFLENFSLSINLSKHNINPAINNVITIMFNTTYLDIVLIYSCSKCYECGFWVSIFTEDHLGRGRTFHTYNYAVKIHHQTR